MAAEVLDADGKSMETQPEVTWASSDEAIATVKDGEVTGVAEGKATITATVKTEDGKEIKGEYEITVDATAPKIDKSEITDYKTITLTFSEAVTGTPVAEVYKDGSRKALAGITAKLAEDGKTLTVESEAALAGDADYEVKVKDVTDAAKNPIGDKASVTLKKAKSQIKDLVVTTPNVPAPKSGATLVYYTVKDQYGEAKDSLAGTLTAKAEIDGTGYPIDATVSNTVDKKNYISLAYNSTMVEGKNITISYTNKVSDKESYTGKVTVALVKNEGVGVPTAIDKLTISDANAVVKNKGTQTAAEYTLDTVTQNNKFDLNVALQDKFGYPVVSNAKVTYVSSNTNVLKFSGTTASTYTDTSAPRVEMVGVGEATIKAYLENNDTVSASVTVKVNPVALSSIVLSASTKNTGKNGTDNYFKITLNPDGMTNLGASDLDFVITEGADVAKAELVSGYDADKTHVYLKVTTVANGKSSNTVKFTVFAKATGSYDATTKKFTKGTILGSNSLTTDPDSVVKSIEVTPFETNELTEGVTKKAKLVLKNASGEDITAEETVKNITATCGPKDVITKATVGYDATKKEAYLEVGAGKEGTGTIVLYFGTVHTDVSIAVSKKAAISTVSLSTTAVDVINKNTIKDNADTSIVQIGTTVYKLVIPTFYNQYTKAMDVTAGEVAITAVRAYGNNCVALHKTGNTYSVATSTEKIDALGVYADFDEADAANAANLTSDGVFKITSADGKTEYARLTVTAKAARSLKEATVASNVTTAVIGKTLTVKVTGKDQYGTAVNNVTFADFDVTTPDDVTFIANGNEATVVSSKAGTYTLTFTNKATKATCDYTFTVVAKTAVDKIVIQPTIKSNDVDYDSANYKVKVVAGKNIAASVKAYVGAAEVAIDDSEIAYTYEATPAKDSALAIDEDGKTIKTAGAGTIKVSATQKFSTAKIDAITINVDGVAGVPTTDTSFTTKNANGTYTNITSATVAKGSVAAGAKSTAVYLHAIDQYGKDYVYPVTQDNVKLIGAPTGAEPKVDNNMITITSKGENTSVAGSATLRVVLGTSVYDLPVTIA